MSTIQDRAEAYRAGWNASERTRTYDLDAAEDRFVARHGRDCLADFIRGWVDHASDYSPGTAYINAARYASSEKFDSTYEPVAYAETVALAEIFGYVAPADVEQEDGACSECGATSPNSPDSHDIGCKLAPLAHGRRSQGMTYNAETRCWQASMVGGLSYDIVTDSYI